MDELARIALLCQLCSSVWYSSIRRTPFPQSASILLAQWLLGHHSCLHDISVDAPLLSADTIFE